MLEALQALGDDWYFAYGFDEGRFWCGIFNHDTEEPFVYADSENPIPQKAYVEAINELNQKLSEKKGEKGNEQLHS